MGLVIGVTARKGGVGKTTLACLVAYQAAVRRGRRTLLLDLDVDQADASTWMLRGLVNRDSLRSGQVYPTKHSNLSVVWATELSEIPPLGGYAVVVIDGRPSEDVAGAVLGLADVVVIPYCDATGHAHAVRLARLSDVPAFVLHNAILGIRTKVEGNARRVGYSKALRSKKWGGVRRDLYNDITAQLARARRKANE